MVFDNLETNNTNRTLTIFIVVGLLSLFYWYISDTFALWTSTTNPLLALIVGILLNPAYIYLIYDLYKSYKLRGIIAGLLISISFDIISLTHSLLKVGLLPTQTESLPLYGYSDLAIYKFMYPIIHGPIGVFLLYVVIPVGLIYLAFATIKRTTSFNRIFRKAL